MLDLIAWMMGIVVAWLVWLTFWPHKDEPVDETARKVIDALAKKIGYRAEFYHNFPSGIVPHSSKIPANAQDFYTLMEYLNLQFVEEGRKIVKKK